MPACRESLPTPKGVYMQVFLCRKVFSRKIWNFSCINYVPASCFVQTVVTIQTSVAPVSPDTLLTETPSISVTLLFERAWTRNSSVNLFRRKTKRHNDDRNCFVYWFLLLHFKNDIFYMMSYGEPKRYDASSTTDGEESTSVVACRTLKKYNFATIT